MKWLLLICLLLPVPARAEDLTQFAWTQRQGATLPLAARFTDASGQSNDLAHLLAGKPAILVPGYFHCPNLCGIERADLYGALQHADLPPDSYRLLVVTIDPHETPADAAHARGELPTSLERQTSFLTGDATALAAAIGFHARWDDPSRQFLHPSGLVFVTSDGRVSSYLLGVGYQPGDIATGLDRARNGILARALPVLLLCFHFDATTGRYTLAVEKLLKLGAVLTMLTLGGTILLLRRQR